MITKELVEFWFETFPRELEFIITDIKILLNFTMIIPTSKNLSESDETTLMNQLSKEKYKLKNNLRNSTLFSKKFIPNFQTRNSIYKNLMFF